MKHSVLVAVSLAALALAGCKKSETNTADANTSAGAADVSGSVAAAVNADQAFVDAVASSDAFEIQTSQLAIKKGQTGATKRFAEAMIKAHTDATAKLNSAAASANPALTPQPTLSATQQQQLDGLATLTGAAFGAAYKQAQVDAHQTALNGLKAYSANGGQASLKTFATASIPAVTAHLNMAKGL